MSESQKRILFKFLLDVGEVLGELYCTPSMEEREAGRKVWRLIEKERLIHEIFTVEAQATLEAAYKIFDHDL